MKPKKSGTDITEVKKRINGKWPGPASVWASSKVSSSPITPNTAWTAFSEKEATSALSRTNDLSYLEPFVRFIRRFIRHAPQTVFRVFPFCWNRTSASLSLCTAAQECRSMPRPFLPRFSRIFSVRAFFSEYYQTVKRNLTTWDQFTKNICLSNLLK